MSSASMQHAGSADAKRLDELHTDRERGTLGMYLFIATEAMLFVLLFFSYYYLARGEWMWPSEHPPKLKWVIPMLIVLLVSSAVLHWGEKRLHHGRQGAARGALVGTIVLGIAFLVLQGFEYHEHLKTLTPQTNAYGSIFYTMTSFHAAHLALGLLMLGFVLALPRLDEGHKPPHRPYHDASLYWHFVDLVWIFIVGLIYILPNLKR